jgi:hypothetical protein
MKWKTKTTTLLKQSDNCSLISIRHFEYCDINVQRDIKKKKQHKKPHLYGRIISLEGRVFGYNLPLFIVIELSQQSEAII